MHGSVFAWERAKFGVEGRSPRGEVQEAGGGLLPQGLGARSPQQSHKRGLGRVAPSKATSVVWGA